MELAIITAKQVVILYCLILAGFAGVKSGVIKPEAKKAFSNLLLYLAVPAMVIHSYISKADRSVLARLPQTFAFSVLAILARLAITMLCTCRMKGKERPILRFACIFSNAAYMGFPLIEALFSAEGLIYASVYVTVFNILLWKTTISELILRRSYTQQVFPRLRSREHLIV
jgi:predicted permease